MSTIEKRLSAFRIKLSEKNLDAVLITKRESYIYLSGFNGTSAFLIITQNDALLVTDFRYVEQAGKQADKYEIVQYQGNVINTLSDVLKSRNVEKLGFEDRDLNYRKYLEYREKLGVKEFAPVEGMIDELRMIKDTDEINIIEKAVEIADKAFTHILSYIRPGVKEVEVAAELEYHMKKLGARKTSFDSIVASGKRASLPHGVASEKAIEAGDVITLDFGALYNDYCSDMTRTVFLGEPDREIRRIYGIVLEAQLRAIEGAKKGLKGKEVDSIARDIIYNNGFEKNFGHGLGHCLGLEIHEEPRFSPTGETNMENGMVVTVEPGIYVSGLGGVRIEDVIIINDDKPTILTKSTKELIVL